jgi:hypothetical protein
MRSEEMDVDTDRAWDIALDGAKDNAFCEEDGN